VKGAKLPKKILRKNPCILKTDNTLNEALRVHCGGGESRRNVSTYHLEVVADRSQSDKTGEHNEYVLDAFAR